MVYNNTGSLNKHRVITSIRQPIRKLIYEKKKKNIIFTTIIIIIIDYANKQASGKRANG